MKTIKQKVWDSIGKDDWNLNTESMIKNTIDKTLKEVLDYACVLKANRRKHGGDLNGFIEIFIKEIQEGEK